MDGCARGPAPAMRTKREPVAIATRSPSRPLARSELLWAGRVPPSDPGSQFGDGRGPTRPLGRRSTIGVSRCGESARGHSPSSYGSASWTRAGSDLTRAQNGLLARFGVLQRSSRSGQQALGGNLGGQWRAMGGGNAGSHGNHGNVVSVSCRIQRS